MMAITKEEQFARDLERMRAKAEEVDAINPTHYKRSGIECIDVIRAATERLTGEEAYCTGAVIKYLFRWKEKGGKEDLRKARWYLNRMLGDE